MEKETKPTEETISSDSEEQSAVQTVKAYDARKIRKELETLRSQNESLTGKLDAFISALTAEAEKPKIEPAKKTFLESVLSDLNEFFGLKNHE